MGADLNGVGSLESAIEGIKDDYADDAEYRVVSPASYSVHVEYGTKHMDAQPFMRPAAEAAKAQAPEIIKGAESLDAAARKIALVALAEAKRLAAVDTGYMRAQIQIQDESGETVSSSSVGEEGA